MRLKKPIIAVTAIALAALAACGGDDGGGPSGADNTSEFISEQNAGSGKDPNRQAPAPDIEGAVEGGTVTVESVNGLNTMDPTEAYYINTASILTGLVTRSLTQYVYDEETQGMVLVPDLATDLGRPNEDFTEWTFTLREGIKYENGQEVTPEDIKYGIMRSMDRETFPEGAAFSNDYFLDGATYKGPYKSGTDYNGVVINGQDITIKMSRPFPDMPFWGAFPAMGPIPPGKASDPAKYRLHPWATGPYMFSEYTPEKSLTLVKNPNWDPATDPGRHAYVDTWEMSFDTDTAKIDQIMLADSGEGQTTMTFDDVQASTYFQMKDTAADRLVQGSQPCTFYWAPDYRKIKEKAVRQALAWAYPYDAANEAAGNIVGVNRIYGGNILPPGIPGREDFNPLPDHELGTTDPAKAKELLQQAGYKPGEYDITFSFANDDPLSVDTKDVIVAALKEAGFNPKPYASTVEESSTLRADPNAPLNVRSAGWCSDWPAGSSWFPPLFETTNLEEEGLGSNYAVFSEPSIDKKINDILGMPLEDQPAAWNTLDQELAEEFFPVFVTGYSAVVMARGSKINGFNNDATYGMPTWKDIWVAQ
jgi:peptide/nickel transport system substrate-binding protein